MGIASINEDQLTGGMAGFFGKKKSHRVGNLFCRCHSVPQWDSRNNFLEFFFRIVEGGYPSFILWGHRFGHDHRIDPDGVGQELQRPFPGK